MKSGEILHVIPELFAHQLNDQITSEWKTRTRSKMRVTVTAGKKMLERGIAESNSLLIAEAESKLADITVISTRLAEINYGDGIGLEALEELVDAKKLALINPQIKRARAAMKKAQKAINVLANTVIGLKVIASPDKQKEIEG